MKRHSKGHKYLFTCILLSIIMAAGCSDNTLPSNLEPVISLSDATDISRTEATLHAKIETRGETPLAYARIIYGETEETDIKSADPERIAENMQFQLSGLKPGTSYSCHIEAGTQTALILSNTVRFSTLPIEAPILSPVTSLSSGPIGIIVSFTIHDDGGEPIVEAGCEVTSSDSSHFRRIYPAESVTDDGYYRLSITGLSPDTQYTITPFASNSHEKAYGESIEYTTTGGIVLQEPGALASLLASGEGNTLENMSISGPMNGDDFKILRTLLGATGISSNSMITISSGEVYLQDVSIVEGGNSYDESHFTVNDEVSTGLFSGCGLLQKIVLPNRAVRIASDAFANCQKLEHITVSAATEEILPSSPCQSLRNIEVSAANSRFTSIDGVLYDHDASDIIWYPAGKHGDYLFPSSVRTIGESAFAYSLVTAMVVPPTITAIGRYAFANSSLSQIRLPDQISNIPEGLFQNCPMLKSVWMGKGTEYIGNMAFDGTSVKDMYLKAEVPPLLAEKAFANRDYDIFSSCTLHIPKGCTQIYLSHPVWSRFIHIVELQPSDSHGY